jgi:hypothetical protein
MNLKPQPKVDPITLDGLEPLLDQAHIEIVDSGPVLELELEKTSAYHETRTLLELLSQVHKVHELLSETNLRLTRAYSRVKHMERVVEDQERRLEVLPGLTAQATRAVELQAKLDEAISELEKLRQPWWHRLTRQDVPKI